MIKVKPIIVIEINDDTTDTSHQFSFREPSTPVVGAFFQLSGKNLPKASVQLCQDTIVDEDKDRWNEILQSKPGYATAAASRILDVLGYGVEAKKITTP